MRLVTPTERDREFRGVLAIAKTARSTAGFLPDSAFAERARQATLLVAVDGDDVVAYALYDLPRDEIRLIQLVVAEAHRGRGLARTLVDAIASAHQARRGIVLHCRNDFAAHNMWPKLDFVPWAERAGRSFEGKPLTRWWRGFGHADLFTLAAEADDRALAILDACVFFDLAAKSPGPAQQQLRSDWIVEHVRLAVTDQLLIEIDRSDDPAERKRLRTIAAGMCLPSGIGAGWQTMWAELKAAHPDAPAKDEDDLKHLARAIAASATWVVSTDGSFRRRYARSAEDLGGVRLRSPAEVVREIDESARGDRYRPVDLQGTDVSRREVDAQTLLGLADHFVNHPSGERIRELRRRLEELAAQPHSARLQVIEVDARPRALLAFKEDPTELTVPLLRANNGVGASTIGRHLVAMVRDEAARCTTPRIRVTDAMASGAVRESFAEEGFFSDGADVLAATLEGGGTFEDLIERLEDLDVPIPHDLSSVGDDPDVRRFAAAAAERWYAPFRLRGADLPTFVVPIKPTWATALFDSGLAEGQLFDREWRLGLRRELVYYRSARSGGGIRAPARILWYVSGAAGGQVRALSQLREVVVDQAERLFFRFERLGVYSRRQVSELAGANGTAMALRFSHTRELSRPITLDELREAVTGDPKSRNVVLQGPYALDEHVFDALCDLGAARAA